MPHGSQEYRARKAMEMKWTRDMTNKEIAEELGVRPTTVSNYLNDPPEELKEPARKFRHEVVHATIAELRTQLSTAVERARTAETTEKVFETDENGELVTERVFTDDGRSFMKPKVTDMEFAPDHAVRAASRQEARQIIDMLWDLTGAGEPEEVELSGEVESGLSDEAANTLDRLSSSLESKYGDE